MYIGGSVRILFAIYASNEATSTRNFLKNEAQGLIDQEVEQREI